MHIHMIKKGPKWAKRKAQKIWPPPAGGDPRTPAPPHQHLSPTNTWAGVGAPLGPWNMYDMASTQRAPAPSAQTRSRPSGPPAQPPATHGPLCPKTQASPTPLSPRDRRLSESARGSPAPPFRAQNAAQNQPRLARRCCSSYHQCAPLRVCLSLCPAGLTDTRTRWQPCVALGGSA